MIYAALISRLEVEENMKKRIGAVILIMMMALTGCKTPVEKGVQLLQEKKYNEAIEVFQKEIDQNENLAEAYRGLGLCFWEKEQYGEASDAMGKALDHGAEETASIFHIMGICALKEGEPEKAVYYFEHGKEFKDASEKVLKEMHRGLITSYEKVGALNKAKEALSEYIELYPEDEAATKELEFLSTQAGGQAE